MLVPLKHSAEGFAAASAAMVCPYGMLWGYGVIWMSHGFIMQKIQL
jgi:hypothetical protein